MSSDNKSQALYTLVFDEIIRSPDLSDAEFRLYMIMLSYCTKKRMGGPKQCRLSQETMAGLMRGTDRQIRRLLRGLEDKKLIIGKTNPGNRYPTYDVATDPPPTLCPDELNSGMAKDALSYIREQGGAKTLQRKTRKKRKVIRPTGRPVRVEDAAVDVPADDRAPQALEDPSLVSSDPGQGCPGSTDSTPDKDVRVPGQGCPTTRTRMSGHPGQGCPPCTDVLEMSTSMTPYGVLRDRSSDLAEPSYTPSTSIADDYEGTFRSDIKMEDDMAESAEQREERLRRLKAKREGARSKITDIDRVIERPPGSGADPAPTPVGEEDVVTKTGPFSRGAGKPTKRNRDGSYEVDEDFLTRDPDSVTEVPASEWGLYSHFCRVVRRNFPDAVLPRASGNGKHLRWCKKLLKDYTRYQIYEMIKVFVEDYNNLNLARIFYKYKGTPTPTFEQFFCNADLWLPFIGKGIIAPPAARVSRYLDGYNKRYAPTNDIKRPSEDQGKTVSDPMAALRERLKRGES